MKSKKIAIVVEEIKTVQLYFKNIVTDLGYEVITATSLQEVNTLIAKYENIDIALVSLDITDNVRTVVDSMIKKEIAVILLSGDEDQSIREELEKKDIVDYVQKQTVSESHEVIKLVERLNLNMQETILVVDDSSLFRRLITNLLERHRFNVLEADDGEKALEVLKENKHISMIITDYEMPNLDGLGLIKGVRKKFEIKVLPIIVISSLNSQSTIVDCMKNGANDYLHKPFSHGEFYSRVYLTLSHKENLDIMAEQKKAYETLFYQSSNATLLMENGHFTDCNNAALSLLKLNSKNEIIHKTPLDFSPITQPNGEESIVMNKHIGDSGIKRFEWQFIQADSQAVLVDVIRTSLIVNAKKVTHVVWHDITEMKKLKSELELLNVSLEKRVIQEVSKNKEQASHMLQQSRLAQMGEMISMIAHQWRQPLASISAISGTLTIDIMMDEYKADFFQERLESINGLAQHLSSTIDDFRGFFKENKKIENAKISDIVNGSLQIIGPTLETKNIELKLELNENIEVHTYLNEVKQVILNLLKNAEDIFIEKNQSDAKVHIKEYMENGEAYLSIEDNAGGIPEEIIDKIFDPYFSTKKTKDGTGLGLYMSKTIIEEHCGGKLRVENSDKGAKFIINLPLKSQEQ